MGWWLDQMSGVGRIGGRFLAIAVLLGAFVCCILETGASDFSLSGRALAAQRNPAGPLLPPVVRAERLVRASADHTR